MKLKNREIEKVVVTQRGLVIDNRKSCQPGQELEGEDLEWALENVREERQAIDGEELKEKHYIKIVLEPEKKVDEGKEEEVQEEEEIAEEEEDELPSIKEVKDELYKDDLEEIVEEYDLEVEEPRNKPQYKEAVIGLIEEG